MNYICTKSMSFICCKHLPIILFSFQSLVFIDGNFIVVDLTAKA